MSHLERLVPCAVLIAQREDMRCGLYAVPAQLGSNGLWQVCDACSQSSVVQNACAAAVAQPHDT